MLAGACSSWLSFSEMKKDVNNFEVSDSCSILDYLLAHESKIYALQGQIEIAKVGRSNCKLYLKIAIQTWPQFGAAVANKDSSEATMESILYTNIGY
jgi:hypothetical protein